MEQNTPNRYFVIYKPVGMISQFESPYEQKLLGDLDYTFPMGTHAVGRLDEQSEGLLILTTDKSLTQKLLHPSRKHWRVYLVMVAGKATETNLVNLRGGVDIMLKKRGVYKTDPCLVSLIDNTHKDFATLPEPAALWETWLRFELQEGKNRQIRKMCKSQNLRCKRLIRISIGDLSINGMQPGEVIEMDQETLFKKLGLIKAPVSDS